jgi:hypothetical protein
MMNQLISQNSLLDLLSPQSDGSNELATRAHQLVEFALAEYVRIAELDLGLGRLSLRYQDPQGAAAMRGLYQHWASQADELLGRLRDYGLVENKCTDLERAVGRTLAMLSIPIESLARAEEQFRTGQTYSLEEVRRELRAAAGR